MLYVHCTMYIVHTGREELYCSGSGIFKPVDSVAGPDPDPDPYVFVPPGSGSIGTDPDPSVIKQKL